MRSRRCRKPRRPQPIAWQGNRFVSRQRHVHGRSGLITKGLHWLHVCSGHSRCSIIPLFFETWQQLTGDPIDLTSPEPVKSATLPMQNESETPKLVVEPTLGAPGEPVPIGLALRGAGNDAVVILRGLVSGMELSTGGAVSGDTSQLSATNLPYAWIAPPKGFDGSADLVAELRLSNDKVADRRAIHLEWITPGSPRPHGPTLIGRHSCLSRLGPKVSRSRAG